MTVWIVFGIGSIILVFISWKSLINPHSHGFYRFFAWECILGSFLVNVKYWFHKPFAWYQMISWFLLFASLIPLTLGVYALRTRGKPVSHRKGDESLLAFEKTTTLVTSGIYGNIRHPLYSSLFLLTWGIFFKFLSLEAAGLASLASFFLLLTARADEAECIQFFGPRYIEYMKRTKMFIPKVF